MKKEKKYLWLLPFLLFTGLTYFVNSTDSPNNLKAPEKQEDNYTNGLEKKEGKNVNSIADYSFDIFFHELNDKITVKEKIIWRNKSPYEAREIQFHLYANAYKSNKTLFASAYNVTPEASTFLDIKGIQVNGVPEELIYIQPDVINPFDSTVAKVILQEPVQPFDSVLIYFEYDLKIPVSVKRFGKARGSDFYFVSQWYPKVGVFEKGKWVCNQYFPRLNFYADFGRYRAKINLPDKYTLGSTGIIKKWYTANSRTSFEVVQDGVHDFAFVFSSEIIDTSKIYRREDGSQVNIRLLVQPGREKYIARYFNATEFTLSYFDRNIGNYPYEQITLVDCPRTSASGGMEYPTLFTVGASLFEPEASHYPEKLVMHEFIHQYFYGILANNETAEAWLDEGFASYFASKTAEEYFGAKGYFTFKAFGYLPVYGINFFAYKDIPIIYSLGYFEFPEEGRALERYYRDKLTGAIADTSFELPNTLSYVVNAYSKPELMLHSLARVLGKEKFLKIIRKYYRKYKFKHPKSEDFIALVKSEAKQNIDWFFEEIFYNSKLFDDRVRYLKKIGEREYEFFVERLGDGKFPSDIYCYTESDTIKLKWSDTERYKIFRIVTDSDLTAVEIDPLRKNLFDINYSNNSFTIDTKIWGTASIAVKWFFWIQNALMILGSVG